MLVDKGDTSKEMYQETFMERDASREMMPKIVYFTVASWCERYIKRDASREMHQERYIL